MNARQAPQTTFIVPAYNAQDTILQALASLAAQTVADWEAVIVDDGSRDRTARLVAGAAAADPRLRLVRQRNGGASAARNRGLREARGTFLAFLDADDWIEPDFLETLVPLARGGEAVAYCAYRRILPSGRPSPPDWCPELARSPFDVLVQRCEPAIHCLLLPRRKVVDMGGFDPTLRTCEDWDLWLRLARTGIAFAGTPRVLAHYRMRPQSLSSGGGTASDAVRVHAMALQADARVADPAPRYAQGWADAPARRLERALAGIAPALRQGAIPPGTWIAEALGEDWRSIVMEDPGEMAASIAQAAGAAIRAHPHGSGGDSDEVIARVIAGAIGSIAAIDPWVGALLQDWQDLATAREGGAKGPVRVGRWLALPAALPDLPASIDPPPGCDALLLVGQGPRIPRQDIALPLPKAMDRARAARAILESRGLADMVRMVPTRRIPALAGALLGETMAAVRQGAVTGTAPMRSVAGSVLRRALSRTIGSDCHLRPPCRPGMGAAEGVPILLFGAIVPGAAGILTPEIGTDQLGQLLQLLADEGYAAVSLGDLVAARQGALALPDQPLVLAFADARGFHEQGVLSLLPGPLGRAEVLFTPDDIAARLPQEMLAEAAGAIRCGLRAARLPHATAEALAAVSGWRDQLVRAQGGDPVCAAISDVKGLPDAILHEAGFAFVLSPGSGFARLDLATAVLPAIECRGSEGIGDALENLRQAA